MIQGVGGIVNIFKEYNIIYENAQQDATV